MTDEPQERRKGRSRLALPDGVKSVCSRLLVPVCAMVAAGLGLAALLGWAVGLPFPASFGAEKIPMAPSTAMLLTLYGVTIFLRFRSQRRGVYWIGLSVHAIGALIVLLLGVLSCQGIHPEAEHLGLSIPHAPNLAPVGHMSPLTALCFLLASLSFLASLPLSPARSWRVLAALLPACLLLAISPLLALASLFGTPFLHYGCAFISPSLPTGLAFLALGAALLALALPQARQSLAQGEPATRFPYALIVIFIILTMGILTAGYLFYQGYERRCRIEAEHQLAAVVDLKKAELVKWRAERLDDAGMIYHNAVFLMLISRCFNNPEDSEAKRQIREWLAQFQKHSEYDQVRLLDPDGVTRMSFPADRPPASAAVMQDMAEVLQTGRIMIVDLYRHDYDHRIYLSVLIPILDTLAGNRVIAVLSLRVDPQKYLYPFILSWPMSSQTAETLLVRRDGNEVLLLNDLRFMKDTALKFRIPLERTDVPAVMAVLGRTGIVQGLAYRGEAPVIADVRPVPDSPWFLVARMHISEVYAPAREFLWMIIGLTMALIFGVGTGLAFVWRQQNLGFYQARLAVAEALRKSEKKYRLLTEGLLEGIWQIDKDGNTTFVNQSMARMLGYSVEEMLGRHLFIFMDERAQTIAAQNLERRKQGIVEQHDFEFLHKDGSRIYTTMAASPLLDKAGNYAGALAGVINITDRKRAETELLESRNRISEAQEFNLSILGTSSIGILTYDEAGQCIFANEAAAEIGGTNVDGLLSQNFHQIQSWKKSGMYETALLALSTSIEQQTEVHVVTTFGRDVWLSLRFSSFYAKGKKQLLVFTSDITERKQAEKTLLLHSQIMRNLAEGINLVRLEDGMIMFTNQIFEQRFGYGPGEMIGKDIAIINAPTDKTPEETKKAIIDTLAQTGEWQGEIENIRKDGTRIWCQANVSSFEHPEYGRVGVSVHTDITERKQAEQTRVFLVSMLDATPGFVGFADAKDTHILYINSAGRKMVGVQAQEDLTQLKIADVHPEWTNKLFRDEIIPTATRDGIWTGECAFLNRDGHEIAVMMVLLAHKSPSGEVERFSTVSIDITERKRTEETLKRSEEQYRTLVENLPDYVMRYDRQHRHIFTNSITWRANNLTAEEFIGKTHREIGFDPDLCDIWEKVIDKVFATGQPQVEVLEWGNAFGVKTILEWRVFPESVSCGSVETVLGISRDITERKRAEEKIRRSLAEKEVMLKEIHHRVKNNMQVIISLLNLQADSIKDSTVRTLFEESRNRVSAMALIHERLYQSEDLARIDFKEYMERLVQGIADTYKRDDVHLSVEMESIALDVNVGIPCGLIVNELITNSFKHAFPEGKKGLIRVGINKNSEGNYVLTVEDNGIGFPAEKDLRDTSSLGLRLVMVLTSQINGTITFSRSEGTRFCITFPVII
ncbi:MAG: PAS domain S-box protein [Desulfobulbaceae bacterium]|nr:PAS domain S-box protein [Desulfobulbaceae bacterium]